ncbi:hypothetical protein OsJ_32296 [Oryza sativa Japonica Group]|uniref:Peptidase A1 domain-containing protein n=1 Tax=Oryza sativa subsp. japonica TaxID=39947 RepID=B9G6S9_ORYSJ|nr:hypothetical protein OsJ_32296 [Oryza sativa Japonica Group]
MGRLVTTLLVLCLIPPTMCSLAAAHDDLRRGLEQATRGRLLADATPAGGAAVVPIRWSPPYYVANFTIGTPPQPASAIVDVAGELVWTQCSACRRCFKQDLPVFVPNASSTFKPEPCGTAVCESIPTRSCSGDVCSYKGPPTQLRGTPPAWTPLEPATRTIATAQSGGILVMHTVLPFSLLVDSAYRAFKKAVTEAVGGAAEQPMATPPQPFDLCFKKAAGFSRATAPDLVFTFQGAAALTVPPAKYLIDVGEEKDTACAAILSMAWLNRTGLEGVSVLGSLQQEDVHFLYDLKKETLSFEPADCSSLP